MLQGNVFITGGAGFLGRAIIRRAEREGWPCRFTILSRDEAKQWELRRRWPAVRCLLGDIARTPVAALMAAMAGHETVIHAAATKFIPEAENNVFDTIDINVVGSTNVALAARSAGVAKVVGISTDKACAPLNLYGLTKAIMERAFAEANRLGTTRFMTVRYGNVVGSTGSVIPVFEKQIEDYGEIRVTDPRMTRFWLSADEAVDLILLAIRYADERPGATIIGANPAMAITDLAAAVWQMNWQTKGDGRVVVTGIRPGEKLSEQLFNDQEAPRTYPIVDGDLRPAGFVLLPPTQRLGPFDLLTNAVHTVAGGVQCAEAGYSSDAPVRWLDADEMVKMIRDARTI